MRETWKKIKGFSDYSVSDQGRVRRDVKGIRGGTPGRILTNSRDRNGYAVVGLSRYGNHRKQYVHRLVALAFLGPQPKDTHVAHWDGDGMNPAASNLRWATQSENEADKRRHGRDNYAPKGSRVFGPKLVEWMRMEADRGRSFRCIARQMGVSHNTITTAIRHGAAPREYRI